jgi:hypothetical protein
MFFLVNRASRAEFDSESPPCEGAFKQNILHMNATPYREGMPANEQGIPLEWMTLEWTVAFQDLREFSEFIGREGDIVIRREEWPHPHRLTIYDASIE